jgi:hypothetical protein
MKNRILRLGLVVLAVAAQAAAGFFVFQAEQVQTTARETQAALARDVAQLEARVGEIRSAQSGVVAHGQDPSFWVPKVAALLADATGAIKKIDRGALGPDAAQDLGAAADALTTFGRTSDRIRDLLATEQPLTASSVAFNDAAQQLTTAAGALSSVAPSQAVFVEREASVLRLREAYALGGAAAFTLVVLLLLLPRVRVPDEGALESVTPAGGLGLSFNSPSDVDSLGRSGLDLDMPRLSQATNGDGLPEAAHESEDELARTLQKESQLRLNTEPAVDLVETAKLCGDLAKVKDGAELPAMLARTAEVLDAAGIVIWIAEAGGSVLRPAASHGYSAHTMSKMKALPGKAENAVSVAFSSGRMEVVRGAKDRNGAVVAPINVAGGCVGAMAAEIRHGGETSPAVQSVAAIVAAQLASLVAESTTA